MNETVYVLCAVTSVVCAVLLLRGYSRNRTGLLFWSSLCFIGLALNNLLLFVDASVTPDIVPNIGGDDMTAYRAAIALASVTALLHGLIGELR